MRILRRIIALFVFSGVLLTAETFKDVNYLYKPEGKEKGEQVDGALNFDSPSRLRKKGGFRRDAGTDCVVYVLCEATTNNKVECSAISRRSSGSRRT
ncbi:MAG TPA: hypothetical protein VGR73_18075, partial [Bryobacteraceae bacterium]|nr:hypothetical protein [Bryobacteraceae bacterium]